MVNQVFQSCKKIYFCRVFKKLRTVAMVYLTKGPLKEYSSEVLTLVVGTSEH